MLLFLLFTAIINLIGGEDTFVIPKLEKEIKAHITEEERKDSVLVLLKETEKKTKVFLKQHDKDRNEVEKLLSEDKNESDEIKKTLDLNFTKRRELQRYHIQQRLAMQKLINDDEWVKILENAVTPPEKIKKKNSKRDAKLKSAFEKVILKTKNAINEEVSDTTKKEILLIAFKEFRTALRTLVKDGMRVNYEKNEVLKRKSATEEELILVYENQNEIRQKLYDEFLDFYNVIYDQTSGKERKAIRKELRKVFS